MKSKSLYYITYNYKFLMEKLAWKKMFTKMMMVTFTYLSCFYNCITFGFFFILVCKKHKFIRRCKCLATCNILLNESQSYVINIFTDISHYQSYFRWFSSRSIASITFVMVYSCGGVVFWTSRVCKVCCCTIKMFTTGWH